MVTGLLSFYFPLRDDVSYPPFQSRLATADGRPYSPSAVAMFFTLQIFGGHIGIPFILLTIFKSKNVRRHPMLINFLVTWIIYSTSFCIVLYVGEQFGPEPSFGLCLFQASSIYGTAVMSATAGLSFVLNLWFTLRAMTSNKSVVDQSRMRNYALIIAPYAVFIFFGVFTAMFGRDPKLVSRNRYIFYCTINAEIVDVVPAIAALVMLAVIIFEVLIAMKLYRMQKAFVQMKTNGGPPLHLVIRIGIFSLYSFLVIVACISFWASSGDELPYVIQASLPTAAFLIFGTQQDLLEAWGVLRVWRWMRGKPVAVRVVAEIPKSRPMLNSDIA